MIFHVPRLFFDQCFTTLFILVKQSWLIIGAKKTAPKAGVLTAFNADAEIAFDLQPYKYQCWKRKLRNSQLH